jgi:hypothetical protein
VTVASGLVLAALSRAPEPVSDTSDSGGNEASLARGARAHELGAQLAFEVTPVLGAFYRHRDRGLIAGGELAVAAEVALLTQGRGYRLPLERLETLWRGRRFAVAALAGTGLSLGADASGHYTTWSAALGVFPTFRLAVWELGVRLVYRPALLTSIRFSPAARDHYRDRYPDDRTTLGPERTSVWLAGQRFEVAAAATRPFATDWMLRIRAGVLPSLMAGSRLAVELGQAPWLAEVGIGRRF